MTPDAPSPDAGRTPLDLEAVIARRQKVEALALSLKPTDTLPKGWGGIVGPSADDVPALISEVERLRAALASAPPVPSAPLKEVVWIGESGDYENRGVEVVGRSLDDAVAEVKRIYAPPYKVRWEPVVIEDEDLGHLTGHFESVVGYSIQHTKCVDFTRTPVAGKVGADAALPPPEPVRPSSEDPTGDQERAHAEQGDK